MYARASETPNFWWYCDQRGHPDFSLMLVIGCVLYFPIVVKGTHLDEVMGEITLQSKGIDSEILIETLIREAEREHDVILFEEDIKIELRIN
ncbi:MAG: hypothetical protein R3A45_11350 [Bdellovibrionota bacterium]